MWLNGRSMPYHDHLKENMSMICPNRWFVDQVKEKYGASSHYPPTKEELWLMGLFLNNQGNLWVRNNLINVNINF